MEIALLLAFICFAIFLFSGRTKGREREMIARKRFADSGQFPASQVWASGGGITSEAAVPQGIGFDRKNAKVGIVDDENILFLRNADLIGIEILVGNNSERSARFNPDGTSISVSAASRNTNIILGDDVRIRIEAKGLFSGVYYMHLHDLTRWSSKSLGDQLGVAIEVYAEFTSVLVENYLEKALSIADNLASRHIQTLKNKYVAGCHKDDYGNSNTDAWNKDFGYFYQTVVQPEISKIAELHISKGDVGVDRMVAAAVQYVVESMIESTPNLDTGNASSDMSPLGYEIRCAEALKANGWSVSLSKATGDHGVDILAEVDQVRVALQCKLYASPVGNSAVQEVAAGRVHYNASHAVVVAPNGFTQGARVLAASNNVLLLKETELADLKKFIGLSGAT